MCFTTESCILTHLIISWEHPAAYSSFATKRCMNSVFKGYNMKNENLNTMNTVFMAYPNVNMHESNICDPHSSE